MPDYFQPWLMVRWTSRFCGLSSSRALDSEIQICDVLIPAHGSSMWQTPPPPPRGHGDHSVLTKQSRDVVDKQRVLIKQLEGGKLCPFLLILVDACRHIQDICICLGCIYIYLYLTQNNAC